MPPPVPNSAIDRVEGNVAADAANNTDNHRNNVAADAANNADNRRNTENVNNEIDQISATEAAELSARNAAAKMATDTATLLATTTNAEKTQLLATIASLTGQVTSLSSMNTQFIRNSNRNSSSPSPASSPNATNNTAAPANASAAIFQKQQTKHMKSLTVTPTISQLITFLRNAAKLETSGRSPFATPIQAIIAYAEDSAIVEFAKNTANSEITNWTGLCIPSPGPTSCAEDALRASPPRKVGESFDNYYAAYKSILEACIWVRKLYNKDISHDWAYTYHRQWMVNLTIENASMMSAMILPTSTFSDVFTIACRGVDAAIRVGGTVNTTPHFNEKRLNNVDINMERTANIDDIDDKINRATRSLNDMLNAIDTATNTANRRTPSATGSTAGAAAHPPNNASLATAAPPRHLADVTRQLRTGGVTTATKMGTIHRLARKNANIVAPKITIRKHARIGYNKHNHRHLPPINESIPQKQHAIRTR
jgi:hypothetical protein